MASTASLRADGTVRWVSVNGRRLYRDTPNGRQPIRSIGTVIDVTHLKETEDALRQSELRLRLALEAAQMGTFEADIAGSEAIIDAQEAHLLGLPEETRVVSTDELRARVALDDLQASDAKKERLQQHHEAYHHEFRFRMPDGSERWLSAYAAIRAGRIFGVNFDVTERKRAEAALRESEARLQIATSGAALGVFERDVKTESHSLGERPHVRDLRAYARRRESDQAAVRRRLPTSETTPTHSRRRCKMQSGQAATSTQFAGFARRADHSVGCRSTENAS